MKKLFAFVLSIMLIFCVGCDNRDIGGRYDLYTVAVNSLLGAAGTSVDRPVGIWLEVMEEDDYGRTLFYYHEKSEVSTHSLVICQKSTSGYAYYYEDINFISKAENDFTEQEIALLKEANDWGKEIDESRLICKVIIEEKEFAPIYINYDKIKSTLESIYGPLSISERTGGVIDLTSNFKQQTILYVYARQVYKQYNFVIIIDEDSDFDENAILELEPEDYQNYQEKLKALKLANNWY